MKIIRKLPLPIAGLALGCAAMGNLIKDEIPVLRPILGVVSLLLVLLILIKFFILSKACFEALDNPVVASTFATYPMTITILSTYLKNTPATIAYFIGVILHVILLIYFTKKFVLTFDIKKVFTTWFIMYVGIVAGSVAAPNVGKQSLGRILFYFGLISYAIVLIAVLYRVIKVKNIPEPAQPTLTVFAAPASLLLAGYNSSFASKSLLMVQILLLLSLVFYIVAIVYFIMQIKFPFYPSFSAYTFPFVISGIATKMTNGYFIKIGNKVPMLATLVKLQIYIALAFVFYVLIRYIIFLFENEKATK